MKTTEAQTFAWNDLIEIDDLNGGRKVSIVGKGGTMYCDSLDPATTTPLAIISQGNPVNLGTIVSFVQDNELQSQLAAVREYIENNNKERANDILYQARMLWTLWKNPQELNTSVLDWANAKVEKQEQTIKSHHEGLMAIVQKHKKNSESEE